MSHWDFSRPQTGQHDAPGPAGQGDAAHPDDAYLDDAYPDSDAYPGNGAYSGNGAYPDNARTPDAPLPPRDYWATEASWPADNGWTRDDGGADDGGWPQDEPWPADNGWTRGYQRPAGNRWPGDGRADGGGPADDGLADDGEGTAPYPVTYERAPFTTAGPMPAVRPHGGGDEPWPSAPSPAESGAHENAAAAPDEAAVGGFEERIADFADGRPGNAPWRDSAWPGRREPGVAGREWPGQVPGEPGDDWGYQSGGRRHGGARRWLIPAAVVVAGSAVGAAAVLLTGGHPGGRPGPGAGRPAIPAATPSKTASKAATGAAGTTPATQPATPLTLGEAQRVLAGYTTVNNQANAQRSDTLLATIEAGSSYAIDAGLYQAQRAAGTQPYPAFSPVQATYYLPRGEPAAGPRWFVVQVGNAFTANPEKVTSAEYLLFTQQAPGGPWLDTIEPYLLAGANAPQVAVGADGLATAVAPDSAALTVAPGQLPAATAGSLDSAVGGQVPVTTPGNLADLADRRTWQAAVPGGQVSDLHAPADGVDGQEFALGTTDGGALVFYTDTAQVSITPPPGGQLQLNVPGFFSPGQVLTQARVNYFEQFAAYDPPAAAGGAPVVVASYSAITSAG